MLARIAELIRRFQENWRHELDDHAILAACRDGNYSWRERKLNPILTVRLFLLQILWGNTACNHLPHLAQLDLTGAAYCEARSRLPLQVLQTLLAHCTAQMAESVRETSRWLGHRLFILDGSSFSMPDNTELRDHFGQHGLQKSGCGFPIAHCLALVHYGSGLMQQVLTAPWRTHDLAQATQLHPALEPGDVLLSDRGFCSFAHLALLMNRQVHAIFRVHQRVLVDFTPPGPAVEANDGQEKASAKLAAGRGTAAGARHSMPLIFGDQRFDLGQLPDLMLEWCGITAGEVRAAATTGVRFERHDLVAVGGLQGATTRATCARFRRFQPLREDQFRVPTNTGV